MKASRILFNIAAVFAMIFGALYIFSLVFIPIGIYCFIAAKRFVYKSDNMIDNLTLPNDILKRYVIFASIACFPFGLLAAIAYFIMTGNNIKIETPKAEDNENILVGEIEKEGNSEEYEKPRPVEVEVFEEQTLEEKQAKFDKLKKFHEKGIITDEELEMAKAQLFGEDNKND